MRRKLLVSGMLLGLLSLGLQSCRADEEMRSAYTANSYQSKSPWKEDEVYIKNVITIYEKHRKEIEEQQHLLGTIQWDYAMSMDRYDETYLEVPVVEAGRVIQIVMVPRFGSKVYFRANTDAEKISFYQRIFDAKSFSSPSSQENIANKMECTTKSVTVCAEVGAGWQDDCSTTSTTTCYNVAETFENPDTGGGSGWEDNPGGGAGFDYPDLINQDPCRSTLRMVNNKKMKPAINTLKNLDPKSGESGVKFKPDGTPSAIIPGGESNVNFGDLTGYTGGYHNHPPNYIPMFSPQDINVLLNFALYQGVGGDPTDAYVGMVASDGTHYVMHFSGSYDDAKLNFTPAQMQTFIDNQKLNYSIFKSLGAEGLEKVFFSTLKEMGLEGRASLQRVTENGADTTITNLEKNGNTTTKTECSNS